jgi:hypothetical protein
MQGSSPRRHSEGEDYMRRFFPFLAGIMATAMAADIPVRQIVLYKSGVGYFERSGDLKAVESARLDFKATDMNDVLKSLTVEDKSGAKITGLRYDSSEPLADKLADFPFRVDGQQSLSGFLDQVKGARVEMKYGADTLTGVIVGARTVAASDKNPEREQAVLMLDSGELRTIDLLAASSLRFSDPKLQAQLRDYLAVLNQARSKDKRSVYIDTPDAAGRHIFASYMIPMPLWKSSYRLIFAAEGEPTLEGWAIVDNTTGEDWDQVRLSVVSGRPVSFISRLYDARFLERPTVDLPDERAQGPRLHEGDFEKDVAIAQAAPAPPPPAAAPANMGGAPRQMGALKYRPSAGLAMAEPMRSDALSSVTVNTEGRDLGDLFEYSFASPVTVKKNESTMLPFVQQKIGARKLLIYSESYGQNPMSAAELNNSTGKTLDGGPITVFDSSNYSGEALMETLRAGDKRLISYAVDLGTRITTQFDSSRELLREIHVNRGTLTARSAIQETKTYTIRNVDAKAKTLMIEHPARPGYKLLNQKPAETTSNAWRFEVKLTPDSSQKFAVSEERVYDNRFEVSSLTPDVLLTYVQNKTISDSARRQLKQIADQKQQIGDIDEQTQQTENEIHELITDQERIRQNLMSLTNVSGQQEQVQKYSRQLADQENKLASMRDGLSALRRKKTALQAALNSSIANLDF